MANPTPVAADPIAAVKAKIAELTTLKARVAVLTAELKGFRSELSDALRRGPKRPRKSKAEREAAKAAKAMAAAGGAVVPTHERK